MPEFQNGEITRNAMTVVAWTDNQRREPIDEIRHEDDPETIFRMDD
jgi:hypothetical protein